MRYIKEYHIFSFITGPKVFKRVNVDKLRHISDNNSGESPSVYLYKIRPNYNGDIISRELCVKNSELPGRYHLVRNLYRPDFNIEAKYSGLSNGERSIWLDTEDLDRELTKMNLIIGSLVRIKDNGVEGRVTDIGNAFYSITSDIYRSDGDDLINGSYSKIIVIEGLDRKFYNRLIDQIVVVPDHSQMSLPESLEEEISDYLMDISDSKKFDVKIIKKSSFVGVINFLIEIKLKDGIENNLEIVSLFFRNINTLQKRLKDINGCSMDIEEVTKSSIVVKIFKRR